jgi:HK97 family phage major capsid protein
MSEETKQIVEDLAKEWEEFKAAYEARGDDDGESKQELERMNDRLDQLDVQLQKASLDTRERKDEKSAESKAFEVWARKGDKADPEELKSLSESDDTAGGYLAPADFLAELITGVRENSPIREYATIRQTSRQSVKAPKRTGGLAAQWISEQGTRAETTGLSFGLEEIPNHELYALVDVSNQELEDAVFDVEQLLTDEMSEQFGLAEGTAFVSGNGVGKPEGFLTHSGVSSVTSNTNDALDARDFVDLLYALKEQYHRNAVFALNRLTVRDARKLRDSNGQFLWQPALAQSTPATIIGQPYFMATDMPTVADGAKAVAVADWKRAFWIVDRIQVSMQRDPYTQATSGNTRFIARKRVGGQVVVPEAVKYLTIQ